MKKTDRAFAISLFVIGICTLVIAVSNLTGLDLPDTLKRILGIIELCALLVMAFTGVKKLKKDK